jgi:hypothetical protein
MKKMYDSGFEVAILVIVAICFGIFWGGKVYGTRVMEHQAITRGYASYCPNTGDFAWAGECEVSTQGENK